MSQKITYIHNQAGYKIGSIVYDDSSKSYYVYDAAGVKLGSAQEGMGTWDASGVKVSMEAVPGLLFKQG